MKRHKMIRLSTDGEGQIIKGCVGYICKHCRTAHILNLSKLDEDPMYATIIYKITVICDNCGEKYTIPVYDLIDPNILYAVEQLNFKGYTTVASCEGHNRSKIPYIMFNKKYTFPSLPDKWIYSDDGFEDAESSALYFSKDNYEEYDRSMKWEGLHALNEWVNNLPFLNKEE